MAAVNSEKTAAGEEKFNDVESTASPVDVAEITTTNPYTEINFLGTYAACTLGAMASYGGFVMPATSLALIDADIGPSDSITWVSLVWTLTLAIGYTLIGRLSDIFGRRWFFFGSSLIATIGCIVAATAKNVNQLIGANVLIGLAAASQLSFNYVLGELVPVSHRFWVLGFIFLVIAPIGGIGPYFSRLFIVNTAAGWRWDYYFTIIINGLATLLWFFFYHPPNFNRLHRNRTKTQEVKDLDIIGLVLFIAGLLLFLLGLSWGGVQYPWHSAHVIATLVVGAITLVVFVVYETFVPLNRPIVPMHVFRNRDYSTITVLTTVGGMIYYSMNVIYPTMVQALFTTDIAYGGLLSCAVGGGVVCGQFLGSFLAVPGGHMRLKLIFTTTAMTAFVGGLAGAGQNQKAASALATLGGVMVGILEALAVTLVTIVIDDQKEMGAAVGILGSIRSAGGVLATTIYVAILKNKVAQYTTSIVVPAILKAGLPIDSVKPLLAALATGSEKAIAAVPGVNEQIIGIAVVTTQEAYSKSFTVVFLASISFGALAIIAACFAPNIDNKLSHDVLRRLSGKHTAESAKIEKSTVDKP